MGVALRWREESFICEFNGANDAGLLSIFADEKLVWEEPVQSAAAAYERVRQVLAGLLLELRAKRA